MKHKEYHPPHIYQSQTNYFITSKTVEGNTFFNTKEKLQLLYSLIKKFAEKYDVILHGWVVLPNHNHLLIYVSTENELLLFMKSFHGKSAIEINKIDSTPGRKVWYQYWDRCVRSEKDFGIRLNYIHHNPVKHGYVKNVFAYEFSSIELYLQNYGKDWIMDCFRKYPIVDFTAEQGLE